MVGALGVLHHLHDLPVGVDDVVRARLVVGNSSSAPPIVGPPVWWMMIPLTSWPRPPWFGRAHPDRLEADGQRLIRRHRDRAIRTVPSRHRRRSNTTGRERHLDQQRSKIRSGGVATAVTGPTASAVVWAGVTVSVHAPSARPVVTSVASPALLVVAVTGCASPCRPSRRVAPATDSVFREPVPHLNGNQYRCSCRSTSQMVH